MGRLSRYPKTPWLYDFKDLVSVGDPEIVVFIAGGGTILGLHVVGLEDGDKMIGIRCDELGRPESCAVTNELFVEHEPFNVQSNPRRIAEREDNA